MKQITIISPDVQPSVFTGTQLVACVRAALRSIGRDQPRSRLFWEPAYGGNPKGYYDVYRRLSGGQSSSVGLRFRVDEK